MEPYAAHVSLRWSDMDAYGHVNSTVYFRYMEQARVEWIEAMRFPVRPVTSAEVAAWPATLGAERTVERERR